MKVLKNSIRIVPVALITAFQGIAAWGAAPASYDVPIVELAKLGVNTRTDYRTVVEISEADAIPEIRKLVHLSQLEEAWVFVPKTNLWYDIAKNQRPDHLVGTTASATDANLDFGFLTTIENQQSDLIIYHFHPALSDHLEAIGKSLPPKQRLDSDGLKMAGAIFNVDDALPSSNDLELMTYEEVYFAQLHRNAHMIWKVCSALGVTEFSLTPAGLKKFKNASIKDVETYINLLTKTAQWRYLWGRKMRIDKNPDQYAPALEARFFTDLYNTPEIEVYFSPFPDLLLKTVEN